MKSCSWTGTKAARRNHPRQRSPGPIRTPGYTTATADSEDVLKATIGMVPLGRMGGGREVAQASVFLASAKASFVAGAKLLVDGGVDAV